SSIGPRQSIIKPNPLWSRHPLPGACGTSKTPPSPPASAPPKRNASPSETLEKRSVATTLAHAGPVKSSKRAACENNPPPTHFDGSLQAACIAHFVLLIRWSGLRPCLTERQAAAMHGAICRADRELGGWPAIPAVASRGG